jgi:3-hydroxyacyl-[acyl-carrier protein] dehydratase/trans-2-decenoyl-[acyl-carrier protein] isomerase
MKRIINRRLKLGIADGTMELDGKVIYVTKEMRVGLFS